MIITQTQCLSKSWSWTVWFKMWRFRFIMCRFWCTKVPMWLVIPEMHISHQLIIMTSWNENFCALLALCAGSSPVTGELPSQRQVTRSFDASFDLRLNKWLSKKSSRRWFETPWLSLGRHCNVGCHMNRGWWSLGHSCLWHLIIGIHNSCSVPIAIFSVSRGMLL